MTPTSATITALGTPGRNLALRCALGALALAASTAAAGEAWLTDFEAAKALAAKEGKDLLIGFTGSDWCTYCIRLEKEVFSQRTFLDGTRGHFVRVQLDFPTPRIEQPEALRQQNARLQDEFGVDAYPTVLLADEDGTAYARTGYRPGGARAYLAHLDAFRSAAARHRELLARAETAAGPERAKLLDASLEPLEEGHALEFYGAVVDEIIALDKANAAGLKAKYSRLKADLAARRAEAALVDNLNALYEKDDLDGMLAAVEAYIAAHASAGEPLQRALLHAVRINALKSDLPAARAAYQKLLRAGPDSGVAREAAALFAEIEKVLSGE